VKPGDLVKVKWGFGRGIAVVLSYTRWVGPIRLIDILLNGKIKTRKPEELEVVNESR